MTPLRIALAGLAALAVAMGIGRFAFTPILPMMLRDGVVDLPQASWLASTNYAGYLVGALLCTFDPWLRPGRRPGARADGPALVRLGLAATALLTLAMALPWPAAWPTLRFAAGVASAYVLVHSSGWCLEQLAARGTPALGGVMFAGPGAGIVASGLLASAMVAWQWRASTAWIVFALLAALLSGAVWNVFRQRHEPLPGGSVSKPDDTAASPSADAEGRPPADAAAAAPRPSVEAATGLSSGRREAAAKKHRRAELVTLAAAYGLAGFGYIVTATFLPVIARAAIAGSPLIDLFWPIFGAGVMTGALLASRLRAPVDRRWLLAVAYVVQAGGIGIGIAWPTAPGFALGSVLLGLPFTAISFFTIQELRRIRPHTAATAIGGATALYALGQIAGPPMVAALLQRSGGDAHAAFQQSLGVAAAALLVGAAMFAASAQAWPTRTRRPA